MGLISEDMLRHRKEPDWEGDIYQLVLYSLAVGLQAQLIYEWGVRVSTLALLRAVQRTGGKVISCDTNEVTADYVYDNADAPELLKHWVFHHMTSEDMREIVTDPADMIYIDGTHSLSCVLWEVKNYWPLLKEDGLMILHDTRTFAGGPDVVARLVAEQGIEMVELPFCCGMAVIHKQAGAPERLKL